MKEYLNPKESLENKAKDALRAEALWDSECLKDSAVMNSMHNSVLLSKLDNSYVALAVFTRFRHGKNDLETLNDVQIFYENFKRAIDEREYLSGEGILKFARTAFAVWSAFVMAKHLASVPPEDREQQTPVDPALKVRMAEYVRPSGIGVDEEFFGSAIVPKLRSFGLRQPVIFDENKPLSYIAEVLTE